MPPNDLAGLPRQAGNYIFAAGTAADPIPVFVEEAASVRASALDLQRWETAQNVHGACLIYLRIELGADQTMRKEEKKDIVAAYQPVMNVLAAHGE